MKAKIMQQAPARILTYGIDPAVQPRLSKVLASLSLRECPVSPEQAGQSVGFLAGLPGFSYRAAAAHPPVDCPGALCMCGLSSQQVDALLAALREHAIVIPLKAVMTPTNQKWRLDQLVEELQREHAAFARQKAEENN